MKVGSLFSGIGGFDLGLERAGMMVAWQVEIDEYCRNILSKHWPDVPKYGDIRECGAHNLEAVDLVCGGFPCQPFSYAGKRQGKGDDRFLWPEMLRVISEIRPRWVIGENVIGLLDLEIESVLSGLEGAGYSTQPIIIPACAINAPHRRDRIWILAHYDESSRGSEHGEQQTERATIFSPGSAGNVADAEGKRLQGEWAKRQQEPEAHGTTAIPLWGGSIRDMWEVEPDMVRVADGIPRRVDRLRVLGNAVVPQIPEIIGRMILEIENPAVGAFLAKGHTKKISKEDI